MAQDGDEVLLEIPSFLLLELFRQKILPMDDLPFSLRIGGKKDGRYLVTDLRYPTEVGSDLIKVKLRRVYAVEIVSGGAEN